MMKLTLANRAPSTSRRAVSVQCFVQPQQDTRRALLSALLTTPILFSQPGKYEIEKGLNRHFCGWMDGVQRKKRERDRKARVFCMRCAPPSIHIVIDINGM